MLLSVRDLKVNYGKVAALRGISLDVDEGQIVTLIGANGAGKTTLLRTISGLLRPAAGEIVLEEQPVHGLSPAKIVRMGIAHVPEGRRVFPYMSVLDNLRTGAYTRKNRKEFTDDLEMVYSHFEVLRQRRNQAAGTLSGGEQQMLAIGRALMAHPRIILLDEPSLGLSPMMVQEMARIIIDLNKLGKSVVLVEQNAAMALRMAHRGYVIQTGSIVLTGTGHELLNNDMVRKAYLGG